MTITTDDGFGPLFHQLAAEAATCSVEDAGRVLGIPRSTAYLLAQRYENTDGADGLPVVRVSNRRLRVPLAALRHLLETGATPPRPR